jgi:hypothetical protein
MAAKETNSNLDFLAVFKYVFGDIQIISGIILIIMFKNVINKYYKALTPIIEQLCKERMLF